MSYRFCKKSIRDRLLSLFAALALIAGTVAGFASGKTHDAKAQSFTKQIETGGEITYEPGNDGSAGFVTYKKTHNKATSNIQYYTKHFILSLGKIDVYKSWKPYDPAHNMYDEGIPKWVDVAAGDGQAIEYAKKYGAVMVDLEFFGGEGQSFPKKEVDMGADFCWWDVINDDTVTTTYRFNAEPIFKLIEDYGELNTRQVYISHIFALKWSDNATKPGNDDYTNSFPEYYHGFHRYAEYWTPADMYNIGWNKPKDKNEPTTPQKIAACYNVEVPLSWNATANIIYYDADEKSETYGKTVYTKAGVAVTKMVDASDPSFSVDEPSVKIEGRVTDVDGRTWATTGNYGSKPPMMVQAKGLSGLHVYIDADTWYDLAVEVDSADTATAALRAVVPGATGEVKDYKRVKIHSLKSTFSGKYGADFNYTIKYKDMSPFTRTIDIFVPVKPAGAAVYYNFYDFDSGKAIPGAEKVLVGSFKEGTLVTAAFSLGDLAENWQLRDSGAFDVNAASANDIDTYAEAKNHSSKATDGTYSPAKQTYTIKKTIENGKDYVIWIPLVKKAPKRGIYVGYYDSKKQVQVGSVHKAGSGEEGAANVSVDVSLPSGESLPEGYTFDASGAFDIADATISTYKQYSYAKNYSAKREGSYSYPNYTISKMDKGKDVIVWVPVSDIGITDIPVKVYVRYITVDGKTTLKETTAPDATLGAEYTYTADGSISITKDGVTKTYAIAPVEKYGSRPPKAVYSTKSDNLAGTKYTTTKNVTALALTRNDKDFKFTAAAAGTKAVKIFIPMIESKATNVRIVYIDSKTGAQVGSMVEKKDMARGDTIIPSTTLPSGYEVDLSDDATYKRLAVYKEGSDGIQSNYSDAKSKISSGKVTNLAFSNADNCNCDIPMTSGEKLAVKVFVPVTADGGGSDTMVAVKYFYMESSGKYVFIDKEPLWNTGSPYGRYEYDRDYSGLKLRNSLVAANGKVYKPATFLGMLYGNNASELYGSQNTIDVSAVAGDVFGYVSNAGMYGDDGNKTISLKTMDKGTWHTAYVLCTPDPGLDKNLVIHYINADTGEEIFKETDKKFLEGAPMTWVGVESDLVWGYSFGNGMIREKVTDSEGKAWSPVYYAEADKITEHNCTYTGTKTWAHFAFDSYSANLTTIYYCDMCGGTVRYTGESGTGSSMVVNYDNSSEHEKLHTFSFNHPYKTRWYIHTTYTNIYSDDVSYSNCSDAKFNWRINDEGKGVLDIRAYDLSATDNGTSNGNSYTSTQYFTPSKEAQGNVGILYIPCVPAENSDEYNVTVKYITLKGDGSADKVVGEADGGKAKVGKKYTYTGATSVTKDGVSYSVLGEGEWLAYGSNNYGKAKGDTTNTKGVRAKYDGGSSWTTSKKYSQESDATLYIPVAVGVSVTVKYVVVKSNKTIKKVVKEVNGGAAQFNKKYRYTGDTIVTDESGKEYMVVGSGDALAYGSNSYKNALNDTGNTKGHKSVYDDSGIWTSEKEYQSYENGTLYIPVKASIPVTIVYLHVTSGGPKDLTKFPGAIVFEEPGLPAIPGSSYKTVVRKNIVSDGKTYDIDFVNNVGILPPTTGDTIKTYDYSAANIRTGTTVTTSIPEDADEYFVFVPVQEIKDDTPEIPDPDPDKGKKVLDDTPTAVVKSDIYEVTKAIPSTEDIYSEVTAKQYLYAFNAKNYTGQKTYSVKVSSNVIVVSDDDPDVVISTNPVSADVTVSRNFSYWTVDSFALYVPDKGYVTNMSLANETEMEASFPGTLPTITKTQYGVEANHITEPTYSSTMTMTDVTLSETAASSYDFSTVAQTYASSQIGQISCKNDSFKFNGAVVLSDTAKDTAADKPDLTKLPDASSIPDIKAKSGNYTIPGERKNIKYDSAGRVEYVLKDSVGTQDSDMEKKIEGINSVKVHTPVVATLKITEDNLKYVQDVNADKTKAHVVVGRSDSNGSKGYENSTNDFVLDIDIASGKHISEKGYGTRSDYDKYVVGYGSTVNGTAYPKGVLVMFDFDVMANVGGDADESNDIYIPKGVWNRVYPSYYVPEWAEPGTHTVKVRVIAVNGEGNEEDEQKNKNTTDTKYVAYDELQIEVSGKIYGLTLTSNTSTAPDWKDVFTLSGKIKWMYPTKYGDGTFLEGFDKNMRYYYMAGIRNELGLTMSAKVARKVKDGSGKTKTVESVENKNSNYIYPLLDGSSPALKGTGTLKSGYTWNFRVDTVGRQTANDASKLVVIPTFYWLSKDGTTREKVDLWYSDKVNGKTYNFIKAGSDLDKQNTFVDYALSDTMGIPTNETADVARIRGDKKALSQNVTVFTYGLIEMPLNTKTFSNTTYAELMKNKGTGFTYDQLLQLKQTWYFKYALPDIYHICTAGYDVEAYAKKNGGVTYKEDFWKKDGYLIVHFDIGAYDKNGNLVLTYTNTPQNVADGMCDMWAVEGYVNNRTDSNGNNFTFIDGDVIVCRLPGSTTPPGSTPPGGGTPPGNTPPGEPNPPTNSSEDKLVNRTN